MTHVNLDEVVRIYILGHEAFERELARGKTIDYGQEINTSDINAFQQGYRIFLRPGLHRTQAFIYLMHEIGGTLIPHSIEQTSSETTIKSITIKSITNLPFLAELAQFYFQYAAVTKWCVEDRDNIKDPPALTHDLTNLPVHYHATKEALRLLKLRKSPLSTFPKYYDGSIRPKRNLVKATLLRKDGVEHSYWISPAHPEYRRGGFISVNILEDLCK